MKKKILGTLLVDCRIWREFISSIAEFLTWLILDVKWEKILWKKQHFSVHIQNYCGVEFSVHQR